MLIQVALEDILRGMFIAVPVLLLLSALFSTLENKWGAKIQAPPYLYTYLAAYLLIAFFCIITQEYLLLLVWLVPLLPPFVQASAESVASGRNCFPEVFAKEPKILFLDKSMSRRILFVLLIFLFLQSSSVLFGMFEAKHFGPTARYTLQDGSQFVFLRRYGDSFLFRPIIPEGNEVSKAVEVRTLSDISNVRITKQSN